MSETKPITLKRIQTMVRRLVKQFAPEQVILFGSRARGDAGPDSDVDLLVVMPLKNPRREKRKLEIAMRMALVDLQTPNDIVVVTPDEFDWQQHIPGLIARAASQEGQVLYVRR